MKKSCLFCAFAAVLLLVSTGCAATVVKMSHIGPANLENNIVHYFVSEFTKRVTERTEGRITFERETFQIFTISRIHGQYEAVE